MVRTDIRCRITLTSGSGTLWQSDTIFVHLCWQVVYGAIDQDIRSFLEPFLNGNPPFVLSDAFPAGLMPRPCHSWIRAEASSLEDYVRIKTWKKAKFVTVADFVRICKGEQPEDGPRPDRWQTGLSPHVSLDRRTLTVGEEGNFFEETFSCLQNPSQLDMYIRTDPAWVPRIETLLSLLSKNGFGRDKSTGYGCFRIDGFEPCEELRSVPNPNALISLSSMVPAAHDPIEAWYEARTKYGKLGEGPFGNPFKKPLLQMVPGAVFRSTNPDQETCGSMVTGIAPGFSDAVQNCYGLMVACRIG